MADHIHRGQLRVDAIPDFQKPPREAPPGYAAMPLTNQWPPPHREPVDKSTWRTCHACERLIPVRHDRHREHVHLLRMAAVGMLPVGLSMVS